MSFSLAIERREKAFHQNISSGRRLNWGGDAKIFYDLREAKFLIEGWRCHYNTFRPHSSLGYRPPAPVTALPAAFMPPYTVEAALRPLKPDADFNNRVGPVG